MATLTFVVVGSALGSADPAGAEEAHRRGEFRAQVVGGEPADYAEFREVGTVDFYGPDGAWRGICTATLIAREWALTAGHCQPDATDEAWVHLGGESMQTSDWWRWENVSVRAHPDYRPLEDGSAVDDIGLIRLQGVDHNLTPIDVNSGLDGAYGFPNQDVTLVGWGLDNSGRIPDRRQKVTVPVVDHSVCDSYSKWYFDVWPSQMCVGRPGQGACSGDSGGPALARSGGGWKVVGVVSYGPAACGSSPAYLTRVEHYWDWIGSHIRPSPAPRVWFDVHDSNNVTVFWELGDDGGDELTGVEVTVGDERHLLPTHAYGWAFEGLPAGEYSAAVRVFNRFGGSETTTSARFTIEPAGYFMADAAGGVFAFGSEHVGNLPGPTVDIAPTRSGKGYWTLRPTGDVARAGDASPFGGAPIEAGDAAAVLMPSPVADGYWIVTRRGIVHPRGRAAGHGDLRNVPLNADIIGAAATPSGEGYYLVGSDGGIFTFGDARFHGSTGGIRLNAPVVGLAPDEDGAGYWLVAADGGVFAFDAPFRGSMGGQPLNSSIIGGISYGNGYLMVAGDGGIFNFSNRPFLGSLGGRALSHPVVAVAALR